MKILEQILILIKSLNKKQKLFLMLVVRGLLSTPGKKNFRNQARFVNRTEHTLARQMSKKVNFAEINAALIERRTQDKEGLWIGAHDNSFIEKSGKKTSGLGFHWNGSAGRIEKGLEIDLIGIVKVGPAREGYALSTQQTPPSSATPKKQKRKEGDETKVDWQVEHVKKVTQHFTRLGVRHMAADAAFAKKKYVEGLASLGLHVISKLRKDARLRRPYTGPQKVRGRKRLFDNGKVNDEDFAQSTVDVIEGKKNHRIELRSALLYSVSLQQIIKVVQVRNYQGTEKYGEALLFSTDLDLNALTIYECYVSRFQIEFVIRDAKSFAGLNDCQSRDKRRLHYHFNASFLALNTAKIEDSEAQKNNAAPHPFSMANYTRKYYVEIVVNQIISRFGFDPTLIKSHPAYKSLLSFGEITH